MDLLTCLSVCLLLLATAFLALCMVLKYSTSPLPVVVRYSKEKHYVDPATGIVSQFPLWDSPASVDLSVVVPAYNEEKRLPPMLDECLEYLESRKKVDPSWSYEVIVVDDGSRDKTTTVAQQYTRSRGSDKVRVLTLLRNRGKGGAVRLGVHSARGELILFADADGATHFSDLSKLESALSEVVSVGKMRRGLPPAIVVGSRAHLEKESIAKRSFFRTLLMYGFHFVVWIFAVKSIRDTQCGFKLFTRAAARTCFGSLHVEKWAFDAELLYVAERMGIPISEVAVKWTEIDGSKVVPFWSWIQMGKDLVLLWLRYKIGAWKLVKLD